jgi:hypothetical protein
MNPTTHLTHRWLGLKRRWRSTLASPRAARDAARVIAAQARFTERLCRPCDCCLLAA